MKFTLQHVPVVLRLPYYLIFMLKMVFHTLFCFDFCDLSQAFDFPSIKLLCDFLHFVGKCMSECKNRNNELGGGQNFGPVKKLRFPQTWNFYLYKPY